MAFWFFVSIGTNASAFVRTVSLPRVAVLLSEGKKKEKKVKFYSSFIDNCTQSENCALNRNEFIIQTSALTLQPQLQLMCSSTGITSLPLYLNFESTNSVARTCKRLKILKFINYLSILNQWDLINNVYVCIYVTRKFLVPVTVGSQTSLLFWQQPPHLWIRVHSGKYNTAEEFLRHTVCNSGAQVARFGTSTLARSSPNRAANWTKKNIIIFMMELIAGFLINQWT